MNAFSRNVVSPDFDAGLYAVESEQDIIGAAMAHPEVCQAAFARLRLDALSYPMVGRIVGALKSRMDKGEPTFPHLIRDDLGADPEFEAWGGIAALADLYDRAYAGGVEQNVDAIMDRAQRRALHQLGIEISHMALDTSAGEATSVLAHLEASAAAIARETATASAFSPAGEMIRSAVDFYRARNGVIEFPVGLRKVDYMLGGLNAGESTVLAADSGMGKTIAAMQIAKANAAQGNGVCYFSLEMAKAPMAMRLACDLLYERVNHGGAPASPTLDRAIRNDLTPAQWADMADVAQRIARWPLLMDERPALTVAQIEAAARRQHRAWERQGTKPGPVIVDHIGKVKPDKDRRGDRTNEVADIANDLDAMAKRLGVPVLVLSQINRDIHKAGGADKRPNLSNVKQSAVIVENARQVIFIYRPAYYLRQAMEHESADKRVDMEEEMKKTFHHMYWIIAKASNGPTGDVLTFCEPRCSAVRDMD